MKDAAGRVWTVARYELSERGRRGLLVAWIAVALFLAFGLVAGNVSVSTGSGVSGDEKPLVTSAFSLAQLVGVTSLVVHGFFAAFVSGMPALRERELRTHALLFATRLSPREWVVGKHVAALAVTLGVVFVELAGIAFAAHVLQLGAANARGPFTWGAYAGAFLTFGAPPLVLLTGAALAVAIVTGKRPAVALLPLAFVLILGFGVWQLPATSSAALKTLLGLLDPSGFAWLRFEWLTEDRGVAFYNHTPVPLSPAFVASRAIFVAIGLALPALAAARAQSDHAPPRRSETQISLRRSARDRAPDEASNDARPGGPIDRPTLSTAERGVAPLPSVATVFVAELRLMKTQAGLWLVVPLTLLVSVQEALSLRGPFGTKLAPTAGLLATKSFATLTTLLVVVLLFVVTESMARERTTRVAELVATTKVTTRAIVIGKVLAATTLAALIFALAGVAILALLAVQNPAAIALGPLVLVYGALGVPTALFASSFFAFVFTAVRTRYATYAVGLGAIAASGFAFVRGHSTWWSNWALWRTLTWSDLSVFELERRMLVANRVTVLALAVAFTALAIALYPRRAPDIDDVRARPRAAQWRRRRVVALASAPACAAFALLLLWSHTGPNGSAAKETAKEYWRANVRTFLDAPVPSVARVELRAHVDPRAGTADVDGAYELVNTTDAPLRALPLTLGAHMRSRGFTIDGAPAESEDRAGLHLVKLRSPLRPGERATVGFGYVAELRGRLLGGGAQEFLTPSGGTLTSFSATFVPAVGFVDGVGVDEENRADPRTYEEDFYVGKTPGLLGTGAAFAFRMTISTPSEYVANSVGVLRSEVDEGGIRTRVWEADAKVRFFNVVIGRGWAVARRGDVAIYHHPAHGAQVPELLDAAVAARARYSEWFSPYPWKELRVSEFPGIVHYAQGHPTNINFSESVGFLAAPRESLPFAIAAHEVAHQWWGTLVNPARGPGAAVMTEGLSHMSALLLLEEQRGREARKAFARGMEDRYAQERSVDGELPLVRVNAGDRKGDRALLYDRAGFAFWMLAKHLGTARMTRGFHTFVSAYRDNEDHPALEDLFATLRGEAEDPDRFDALVTTWFRTTSVPRFRIATASVTGRTVQLRVDNEGSGVVDVPVAITDAGGTPRHLVTVAVGPDTPATLAVEVDFDPSDVVVDPDVEVLQLGREAARARITPTEGGARGGSRGGQNGQE